MHTGERARGCEGLTLRPAELEEGELKRNEREREQEREKGGGREERETEPARVCARRDGNGEMRHVAEKKS